MREMISDHDNRTKITYLKDKLAEPIEVDESNQAENNDLKRRCKI